MTRKEAIRIAQGLITDFKCESEHEMNELFYFVLELLKHEQESSCPYYIIDEDGHGLCKNHRLEQELCKTLDDNTVEKYKGLEESLITPNKKITIRVKNDATNGDVVKAIFPYLYTVGITDKKDFFTLDLLKVKDWWNAPYEGSDTE